LTKLHVPSVVCGGLRDPVDYSENRLFENDRSGRSEYDKVTRLAADGWELVAATPVTSAGTTTELVFSFKRPVDDNYVSVPGTTENMPWTPSAALVGRPKHASETQPEHGTDAIGRTGALCCLP
jgi:hypothetical protein